MSPLLERLLSFMFTQAFTSEENDDQEHQVDDHANTGVTQVVHADHKCRENAFLV